jgi:hypothetical protein
MISAVVCRSVSGNALEVLSASCSRAVHVCHTSVRWRTRARDQGVDVRLLVAGGGVRRQALEHRRVSSAVATSRHAAMANPSSVAARDSRAASMLTFRPLRC